MEPMNLRQHPKHKTFYIWYSRFERPPNGQLLSLKTKDRSEANDLLKDRKKNWHKYRLEELDRGPRLTIGEFKDEYLKQRQFLAADTIRADTLALKLFIDAVGEKCAERPSDLKS